MYDSILDPETLLLHMVLDNIEHGGISFRYANPYQSLKPTNNIGKSAKSFSSRFRKFTIRNRFYTQRGV